MFVIETSGYIRYFLPWNLTLHTIPYDEICLVYVSSICLFQAKALTIPPHPSLFQVPVKGETSSDKSMFFMSSSCLIESWKWKFPLCLPGFSNKQRVSNVDPSQIFQRRSRTAASSRRECCCCRRRCCSRASWRVSVRLLLKKILSFTFGNECSPCVVAWYSTVCRSLLCNE